MIKHMMYSLCLFALFLLSGCECPFRCCQYDHVKKQEAVIPQTTKKEQTTTSVTTPLTITSKKQFEKEILQAPGPVIADFSADWCEACKAFQPIFDAVAEKLGTTYKFVTVNVDNVNQVAQELGIQGIPTVVFFKNGKEVNRIAGAITNKEEFISTIEKSFGK